MKTQISILRNRTNVWIFLGLTLAFRFVADEARRPRLPSTLPGLQTALRSAPAAFLWHDLISDQYFYEGELKRSLFHRREALRILEREERRLERSVASSGGSAEKGDT